MKRYVNKSKIKQEVEASLIQDLIAEIWGSGSAPYPSVEDEEIDAEKEELTMQYGWY